MPPLPRHGQSAPRPPQRLVGAGAQLLVNAAVDITHSEEGHERCHAGPTYDDWDRAGLAQVCPLCQSEPTRDGGQGRAREGENSCTSQPQNNGV